MGYSEMTTVFMVFSVLLVTLIHTSTAQNYHFSNGWFPGKKRASNPNTLERGDTISSESSRAHIFGTFDESCNMKPDAVLLINKIVQDEVIRIQQTCFADLSAGVREYLQDTAKLESDNNKW